MSRARRCITDHQPGTRALSGHFIVCGLEGIGVTIVEQLHRSGQQVVVLEQFTNPAQLASVSGWITAVIASKGSLATTLDAAGIPTVLVSADGEAVPGGAPVRLTFACPSCGNS